MKKGLVVLAVLAMAAPLYAGTITFTATDNGPMGPPATCTLAWTSDVAIVALGLDIDADEPVTINSIDSFFDIFMDLAYDMENNGGYNYGDGNTDPNKAAAYQGAAGQISLPANSFAISAGGLGGASEPLTPPPFSGSIVLSSVANNTGTIGANALRGGVVDEDGAQVTIAGDSTWTITVEEESLDCMTDEGIDVSDPVRYTHFLAAGSPECWCATRQCHGDADNAMIGTSTKTGYYAVGGPDLEVMLAGWGVQEPPDDIGIAAVPDVNGVKAACANFDNDAVEDPLVGGSGTLPGGRIGTSTKTGYYYIGGGDLDILLAYWGTQEPPDDIGVPDDCDPGNL